ncbi:hypothetical protein J4G37_47465, partial [Microvirga sp. 3-52]|nr:hypothetical protein [Microvirga sp. 3-52]
MRKKLIVILALSLMLLVACTNPDNKNEAGTNTEPPEILKETGMPIVDEEITLNFFAGKAPATADNWNDVMLF